MTEKQRILWDMWVAGAAVRDIAAALGISANAVYTLRHQYGLPNRPRVNSHPDDPTPEQIAERARECRERHYARRRTESEETTRIKLWNYEQKLKRNRLRTNRKHTRHG